MFKYAWPSHPMRSMPEYDVPCARLPFPADFGVEGSLKQSQCPNVKKRSQKVKNCPVCTFPASDVPNYKVFSPMLLIGQHVRVILPPVGLAWLDKVFCILVWLKKLFKKIPIYIWPRLWLCRSEDEIKVCYVHTEISKETDGADKVVSTLVFKYEWPSFPIRSVPDSPWWINLKALGDGCFLMHQIYFAFKKLTTTTQEVKVS